LIPERHKLCSITEKDKDEITVQSRKTSK